MTLIEKTYNRFSEIESMNEQLNENRNARLLMGMDADINEYYILTISIKELERKIKSAVKRLATDLGFSVNIHKGAKEVDIYIHALGHLRTAWDKAMGGLYDGNHDYWLKQNH